MLKQLGLHRKPIVLINTGGFYDPLVEPFERMYRERFVKLASGGYAMLRRMQNLLSRILTPTDQGTSPQSGSEVVSGMPKRDAVTVEERQKRALEQIITDSSLTDYLDDPEAARLIEWGAAATRWLVAQTDEMDDQQADAYLEPHLQTLRGVMRRVNRLVGELADMDADEMAERLGRIFEAVAGIPMPAEPVVPADTHELVQQLQQLSPEQALAVLLSALGERGHEA